MSDSIYLLLPIIFLAAIFSVCAGGGTTMILILFGSSFTDLRTIIVISSYIVLINAISKASHFYSYARWDVVLWLCIGGLPLTYMGGLFLFSMPIEVLKLLIALIAVVFIGLRSFRVIPSIAITKTRIFFLGAITGFVGGAVGHSAMIRKPILSAMGLSKEIFIGTSSCVGILWSIAKISAYMQNISLNQDIFLVILLSIPLIFCATFIGKKIVGLMSAKQFAILLHTVILIGAIRLLFS